MRKRVLSLALAVVLCLGLSVPAFAAGAVPFSDVGAGQWYTDGIIQSFHDGIMTGTAYNEATGERKFSPFSSLTMAEWSVMLVRAWYGPELSASTVGYITWYNREAAVLQEKGVYQGIGTNNDITMYVPATRVQMAVTIANLLKDKGVVVSAADIAQAKAKIPDLSTIPAAYQDSVATCYHLGILTGKSGGNFCGNDSMQRCEAATVYVRVKNVLNGKQAGDANDPTLPINPLPTPSTPVDPIPSTPVDPNPTPSTPVNGSPVGTISSERVTINANSVVTHAPITDYWSQQPMEIRNISDRNYFNAACQTIKDAELMTTQGSLLATGVNPYYNYAVAAPVTAQTATNVNRAVTNLSAVGCTFQGKDSSAYAYYFARPLRTTTTSAPRFASTIASLTPDMSDRAVVEACLNSVCAQLDYVVNGGASWDNGGTQGDCASYSRMLTQLLSAAGIPNFHVAGDVKNSVYQGGHAWVLAKLDGVWMCIDGVSAERGNGGIFTIAEHESRWGYSGTNDSDSYRVGRALVDIFF